MSDTCTHLDQIATHVSPGDAGCHECLESGDRWVHLRLCMTCGHIGCCDSSPNRHASAHARTAGHAIIRSFEPDEDWWYCYPDDLAFEIDGAEPAPSHP
jgi:hypothetical protein